jgi:hypothetical protein
MRIVVVYKEQTDYARQVNDYMRDFERDTGRTLEPLNPETREGVGFCETYGILQYPTILALTDDGQVRGQWTGLPLPMIGEVASYA